MSFLNWERYGRLTSACTIELSMGLSRGDNSMACSHRCGRGGDGSIRRPYLPHSIMNDSLGHSSVEMFLYQVPFILSNHLISDCGLAGIHRLCNR